MSARARALAAAALLCLIAAPSAVRAHEGHGDLQMWRACDGAALDAECSFENAAHDTFRGTCRSVSGDRICVRNRPIERAAALPENMDAGQPGGGPWVPVVWLAAIGLLAVAVRTSSPKNVRAWEASK